MDERLYGAALTQVPDSSITFLMGVHGGMTSEPTGSLTQAPRQSRRTVRLAEHFGDRRRDGCLRDPSGSTDLPHGLAPLDG